MHITACLSLTTTLLWIHLHWPYSHSCNLDVPWGMWETILKSLDKTTICLKSSYQGDSYLFIYLAWLINTPFQLVPISTTVNRITNMSNYSICGQYVNITVDILCVFSQCPITFLHLSFVKHVHLFTCFCCSKVRQRQAAVVLLNTGGYAPASLQTQWNSVHTQTYQFMVFTCLQWSLVF